MLASLLPLLLAFSPQALADDRGARAGDAAYVDDDPESYVPAPKDRLWFSNASFARYNPLGLVNVYRVGWRHRLSDKDSVMLQDTYSFLGLNTLVTPAYARLGIYGEAQVLAVLRFFGSFSGTDYYGTFDQILTWEDPDAYYPDDELGRLGDGARMALGWTATAGTTVRAKAGPVAIRSTAQVSTIDLALGEENGQYFYDQYWDRLALDGGWALLNDADILYVQGKLRLGVRHTFMTNLDDRPADTDGALNLHRMGPLFAWQFAEKAPGAKHNQPTLFVLAQWWLQHPYRTGAEQPGSLPLIAAGYAFNGDLKILSR